MKPIEAVRFMFTLTLATALSAASAADPSSEDHQAHHPDTAQAAPATAAPAASIPALQQRMRAIRETTDPARRMALMDEQMQAMESMMQGMPADCPMMGGAIGGQGPDMMRDHMQKMEKHLEMMRQMMEMHIKTPPSGSGQ